MKTYEKVTGAYFKSIKYFNEFESIPRDFGTGDLLYSSEIHTIEVVGKHPGINLTELSNKLDITIAGASKFVKKLVEKDLLVKSRLVDNKKEVIFFLTRNGQIAYEGHELYSNKVFGAIHQMMSEMKEEDLKKLENFLNQLNTIVLDGLNKG